jgi:hypothetical protein
VRRRLTGNDSIHVVPTAFNERPARLVPEDDQPVADGRKRLERRIRKCAKGVVPPSVPSLRQSSSPPARSLAAKKSVSPIAIRPCGEGPTPSVLRSSGGPLLGREQDPVAEGEQVLRIPERLGQPVRHLHRPRRRAVGLPEALAGAEEEP